MTNKEVCPRDKCTGCGLCNYMCPQNCISMIEDSEGFLIPTINENGCVKCDLCQKVCPSINPAENSNDIQAYASQLKDKNALHKSASGGMAYIIAKKFLENGGIVFGCAFDDCLVARHIKVESVDDLLLLQGAKYVQSNTIEIYEEIKRVSLLGKKILFIGTPCQVAAVKRFVTNKEQLITVDLICHGVSSPRLFKKYIEWREKGIPANERKYQFRDKTLNGWGTTCSYITLKNNNAITCYCRSDRDPYYSDFLAGKNYRECCYQCTYACRSRVGDFTIGDYWGISREHPEFKDIRQGVSALLVNSYVGNEFLNTLKDDLVLVPSSIEKVAKSNGNLSHPVYRPQCRDDYYEILDKKYEIYVKKFYFSYGYLKSSIKDILRRLK